MSREIESITEYLTNNNPENLYKLGEQHFAKNPILAFQLFAAAAVRGHREALIQMHRCFGSVLYSNPHKFFNICRKLYDEGNMYVKCYVGYGIHFGYIKSENRCIGMNTLIEAAEGNCQGAQYILYDIYKRGEGVEADIPKAMSWLKKAAENDNVLAQNKLADEYLSGEHIEKDKDAALRWLSRAGQNGDRWAIEDYYDLTGFNKD